MSIAALLEWLRTRDRDRAALRRAGRAAIVMPAMFAIGDKVIGNLNVATFAAFGSFATLVLVGFGGPMRERLEAQTALALAGGVLVCVGTLASRNPWLAAISMAIVAFCVLFAGVLGPISEGLCERGLNRLIDGCVPFDQGGRDGIGQS